MAFVRNLWRDETGVVESALVMIPLVALFLITVQLIVAVNYRNIDQTYAQGAAATEAISAVVPVSDEIISFTSPHSFEDLRLVVSHRTSLLPSLIASLPFFSAIQSRSIGVSGVAVMERGH